jgi:hypothetical protein
MKAARGIRRAAAVTGAGLALQLAASFHWTPGTFVLSAAAGIPLVLAGSVLFVVAVLRVMRDKGAL